MVNILCIMHNDKIKLQWYCLSSYKTDSLLLCEQWSTVLRLIWSHGSKAMALNLVDRVAKWYRSHKYINEKVVRFGFSITLNLQNAMISFHNMYYVIYDLSVCKYSFSPPVLEYFMVENSGPHVLRPLHFRNWIKALLRPSTKTNLCYLKFD